MKMKKLLLAGIIMLAVFTLAAVSAADNASLTAGEGGLETTDETLLGEDEYITVEIEQADEIMYGRYNSLDITVAENVTGYVKYYVDDNEDYQDPEYISHDEPISTGFGVDGFGAHTLHVKYFEGNRPDKSFEFPFTVSDYYLSVYPVDDDELRYNSNAGFCLSIPYEARGTVSVLVNDNEYKIRYDDDFGWDDHEFTIKKEHIVYGENRIKATFTPYDKTSEFRQKTVEKIYNFTSRIEAPASIDYNTQRNVTLALPGDAEGTLTVIINEKAYSQKIKNGRAAVAIPKLNVGYHEIFAKFEGNYEIENLDETLSVVPKVIAPQYMWAKGEQKITIEMSDDITGTVTASVDGDEIASAEIRNGTAVLAFDLPAKYHYISLDYSVDKYIPYYDISIEVLDDDPNWKMKLNGNDMMKTHAFLTIENIPEHISPEDGVFELTVDGKKVECEYMTANIYFDASDMSAGQHTYTLTFNGDGYYLPTSESGKFNISDMAVRAPEKYVHCYESDDGQWLRIYMPNDTAGTLTVKVNGKQIYSEKTAPDDDYAYESFLLEDLGLKFGATNRIEVRFASSKYPTLTKTVDVYATYVLMTEPETRYGGSRLPLVIPGNLDTSKLSVKIDGVDCEVLDGGENAEEFRYVMTSRDLSIGYHNATVSYKGDRTYPANTNTSRFRVYASIEIENDAVSLILPDDAKGNLTVSLGEDEYANVKAKGNAEVDLSRLHWGTYYVYARYTGDDYQVSDEDRIVSVCPQFMVPQKMIVGTDESVSVDLPGTEGSLEIYGDDITYATADLAGGRASISLAGLSAGKHILSVGFTHYYYNDDGYEDHDYYGKDFEIEVINPITARDAAILYSAAGTYTAQIRDVNAKAVTSGSVTFIILDGKKQILKKTVNIKNGAAKLTYKITQAPKTYTIKTVYNKASVTKKLTVKSITTLKAVTVKKSAKKLVLQAALKKVNGKYLKKKTVVFKFNGKTYKAKTNAKGVAKVTVKKAVLSKLKVGKKITYSATYLKDTVKRTAKVKK